MNGGESLVGTVAALAISIDPNIALPAAATIVAAAIAALATWSTMRVQHKGKPEHALIDQLQEDLEALRQQVKADREAAQSEIKELKEEVGDTKRRERIRDDYINALRQDILDGRPPPPREWPPELIT